MGPCSGKPVAGELCPTFHDNGERKPVVGQESMVPNAEGRTAVEHGEGKAL